jgi:hypothetical protein
MTVYLDSAGHLVADSLEELHRFARRIGLKREWFQEGRLPHYDLTSAGKIREAMAARAKMVSSQAIVRVARRMQ